MTFARCHRTLQRPDITAARTSASARAWSSEMPVGAEVDSCTSTRCLRVAPAASYACKAALFAAAFADASLRRASILASRASVARQRTAERPGELSRRGGELVNGIMMRSCCSKK